METHRPILSEAVEETGLHANTDSRSIGTNDDNSYSHTVIMYFCVDSAFRASDIPRDSSLFQGVHSEGSSTTNKLITNSRDALVAEIGSARSIAWQKWTVLDVFAARLGPCPVSLKTATI